MLEGGAEEGEKRAEVRAGDCWLFSTVSQAGALTSRWRLGQPLGLHSQIMALPHTWPCPTIHEHAPYMTMLHHTWPCTYIWPCIIHDHAPPYMTMHHTWPCAIHEYVCSSMDIWHKGSSHFLVLNVIDPSEVNSAIFKLPPPLRKETYPIPSVRMISIEYDNP